MLASVDTPSKHMSTYSSYEKYIYVEEKKYITISRIYKCANVPIKMEINFIYKN